MSGGVSGYGWECSEVWDVRICRLKAIDLDVIQRPDRGLRSMRYAARRRLDRMMDALAAVSGPTVLMIDTSIARVLQHGACIADSNQQDVGRSRGGLTSKISRGRRHQRAASPSRPHAQFIVSSVLIRESR